MEEGVPDPAGEPVEDMHTRTVCSGPHTWGPLYDLHQNKSNSDSSLKGREAR